MIVNGSADNAVDPRRLDPLGGRDEARQMAGIAGGRKRARDGE